MTVILSRKGGGSTGSGGPPSGAAGGDLTGTYPNPTIGAGKVTAAQVAADVATQAELDAVAATVRLSLVSDSTLGADAANFDVTGISGSYKALVFYLCGRGTNAATAVAVNIRFNNDSGANYDYIDLNGNAAAGGTAAAVATFAGTSGNIGYVPGSTGVANRASQIKGEIFNYAGTVFHKVCECQMGLTYTNTDEQAGVNHVNWRSTTAITRITILPAAANFLAGSRLTIYGLG